MRGLLLAPLQQVMAHSSQPLLGTPHKAKAFGKILFFAVSISALIISAALFLPSLTKTKKIHTHVADPSFICHKALDPKACHDSVLQVVSDGEVPLDVTIVQKEFLIKQAHEMHKAMMQTKNLRSQINARNEHGALADCIDLIDLSVDLVLDSIQELEKRTSRANANAQAWLSGVLTNHGTCLDGLGSYGKELLGTMLDDLISRASYSLAMLAGMSMPDDEMIQPLWGKLPSWITPWERKLLQKTANAVKADLTVAKDCSGNYKTITEAIAAAPKKSKKRFVIHVKKGTYKENVEVGKSKKNLMIIGDGMDSTIITGNLSVADGSTTFKSATLAAVGEGFILQDICIQNTAGPEKHQAVALRVSADKSVINRCRIDAYQDTLYTHSLRQFYRDCNITGTVDFIFGNAAVVLQKCNILARKPMKSQKNMVTAQGRIDPNQNTGTSIQDCEIRASEDLEPVKSSYPTYLGRPWKEYSRTVVLESYIGDQVDPAGWSEWSGDFALNTLYYGEYMNMGPGADTSKRVNWSGYHVITDAEEATKFTVKELIQGGDWLSYTGVAFTEGLVG